MSYCGICGTPLENDKHICPACGADMRPANKIRQSDYGDLFVGLNPYTVSTEMRKDIAMVIKAMAIMAYIGPCVCVSLSMTKSASQEPRSLVYY